MDYLVRRTCTAENASLRRRGLQSRLNGAAGGAQVQVHLRNHLYVLLDLVDLTARRRFQYLSAGIDRARRELPVNQQG